VAAYTDLLRQAYAAIKSLDGFATVITGGSSPAGGAVGSTFVSPVNWLNGIYANGGQGSFDAVGHHPYTGVPYGPSTIAPWNPFQQTVDLHNIMVAHGDGGKKVWGTEAGAFTGAAARAVSVNAQADFVTQYLQGWSRWPFVGPFFYYSLRDLGTNAGDSEQNYGVLYNNRWPKPAWNTFAGDVAGG
jgi:hypothetical protein